MDFDLILPPVGDKESEFEMLGKNASEPRLVWPVRLGSGEAARSSKG